MKTVALKYPEAKMGDTVDDYHGTLVPDPYRWLEDPDSPETKEFVDAQNAITMPFIENCKYRVKMNQRLTELWNYPKYGCPFKRGSRYFYYMNTGLQNHSVLYVQEGLEGEPKVFFDPNALSEDGTTSLSITAFSEDGEFFAYGLSKSGSDWVTIHVRNVSTGEDYPDKLTNVKFSNISWTHDHKGFFYSMYPVQEGKQEGTETESVMNHTIYYHTLGTEQEKDIKCVSFDDYPNWMTFAEVSDCGNYLLVSAQEGCSDSRVYFCDLKALPNGIQGPLNITCIVDNFDSIYNYITNEGSIFIYRTNNGAPNYRLIKIDLQNPEEENWVDLVAEDPKDILDWSAAVFQDKLVLCYMKDVKNVLKLCDLKTGSQIMDIPIPVGTISGYSGRKKDDVIFYKFVSFLSPGTIYIIDLKEKEPTPKLFRDITLEGFNPDEFETKQVFYTSTDETKVPMFIVHKKDVKLDGSAPCLLSAYGGFNYSRMADFHPLRILIMQNLNGIYASPNLRGGGEYGETWHKAGSLLNKQNTFDDMHCAAQFLIDNKYTSTPKLLINGASNGGLLIGACINQRPDLYGCAVADVGVLDMLRFHKFTIGHAWCSDYGCSDNKEQFHYLYKYSPLHNVGSKKGESFVEYPAVLLTTADHDDRVVPLHSLKFIAELQRVVGSNPKQTKPLLIKVETKAGHGAGKPTKKIIEDLIDKYCFVIETLGLSYQD